MTRHCSDQSRLCAGALAVAALVAATLVWAGEPVTIESAWVPWAPPAMKVHAGYMTVVNHSDADQHIVSAESPDYERVELHESVVEDGLSKMRPLGKVRVPAKGSVAFAPAGRHLMLIGPKRTLGLDSRVRIVLRLRGGQEVAVSAVMRRRDGAPPGGHSH
jgi:periplasmic copper chaperone A